MIFPIINSNIPESSKKAIIVAPHADDETLDAGGLIARLAEDGWEIKVLFITISGFPAVFQKDHSLTEDREEEVISAMKVLRVSSYEALYRGEKEHLKLDVVPQSDIISFIEKHIAIMRPSMVVVPCKGHYHQDHRAVSDACVASLRPAPDSQNRPFVPLVLAYGHSSLGWGGEQFSFRPTVFIDITDVMSLKLTALECYKSQLYQSPHARSLEKTETFSATWGTHAGVKYAEPFECLRFVL